MRLDSDKARFDREQKLMDQGYSYYNVFSKFAAAREMTRLKRNGFDVKDIALPFQGDESVRMHVLFIRSKES